MPAAKIVSAAEAKSLFSDLKDFPALVLAVSGGPDSTALMLLAARWRKALKTGPTLIAVTVDHGLRKEAKREAAGVARLARKLGIAHRILRWTGKKPKTGLQQAARMARYRLLGDAARKAGASHILTAHTLDDQAETVLIRMMRGSGVTGLAAMVRITLLHSAMRAPSPASGGGVGRGTGLAQMPPPGELRSPTSPASGRGKAENAARDGNQIFLVRPLLGIAKARLIATLKAEKIPFADDPSNRDPRFTRARLRGLMPRLAAEGLDARRLSLLAQRLKRADLAIEAAVDRAMAELSLSSAAPGVLAFDATGYAGLPAEIALRLIGRAVAMTGDEGPVELAKLEALKAALDSAQNTATRWRRSLAGAIVTLAGAKITVQRAPPRRGRGLGKALTKHRPGRASHPKTR